MSRSGRILAGLAALTGLLCMAPGHLLADEFMVNVNALSNHAITRQPDGQGLSPAPRVFARSSASTGSILTGLAT